MNLIEQLGGYEKAKSIVDKAPCKTYTFHNHPYQKGYIRCFGGDGKEYFLVSDIEEALLDYRRQHNIFEVGDKVIGSKLFDDRIFEFQYYLPELSMAVISKDGAAIGLNQLRHATPEEIKAGKRLEIVK